MAITAAAIGVFAAAASIATRPTAASSVDGSPTTCDKAAPLVAPMKKIGVTMPPLPPVSSVIEVARILRRKAPAKTAVVPARTPLMVLVPQRDHAKERPAPPSPPDPPNARVTTVAASDANRRQSWGPRCSIKPR